jgi:hypothetical protein
VRKKKIFPPGTFISTPKRLVAIAQLCLTFSVFLWYASLPFMEEHFNLRSQMLLYEYVMGTANINLNHQEKLQRHRERFAALPASKQQEILADYQLLMQQASKSFLAKLKEGAFILLVGISPFKLAWIIFGTTIAILILLKVEGAAFAAWLLPCIALAFAADNALNGYAASVPPDFILFPDETSLIQTYLKEPLSSSLWEQQQQLQKGWQLYLIENWSQPINDSALREEEGEFNFTVARLEKWHGHFSPHRYLALREKSSPLLLSLYVFWNVLFAWIVNRPEKNHTARIK